MDGPKKADCQELSLRVIFGVGTTSKMSGNGGEIKCNVMMCCVFVAPALNSSKPVRTSKCNAHHSEKLLEGLVHPEKTAQ